MMKAADTAGTILRIQRMSTEDGPGIRSTVFFKGCPLSCVWCHNPESISPLAEVHWTGSRCIGCLFCRDICPRGALNNTPDGMVIDREKCNGCMECVRGCPSTAMEAYGEAWQASDLLRETLKDRVYFQTSGGGVTLSGGEPTMQPDFSLTLLRELRSQGVSTALDTCGLCRWDTLVELLPYTDLVLFDIKEINPASHKMFTGATNQRILENLIALGGTKKDLGMPQDLWIRTPLIPGHTAFTENISGIGAFISEHLAGVVSRWELCTFNNLCTHKYEGLGRDWTFKKAALLGKEEAEKMASAARASGVDPEIVHLSGPLRLETAGGALHGTETPVT